MVVQNLGRVGLVLKGDWSATTQYEKLDVIAYDGNSWVAKRSNKNVTPNTTNSDDWQLISNNADLVSTVQGYKNDAAASAAAAASSAALGEDAVDAIAPAYSDLTFPVSAGQWCWYNGTLYAANQDISTSESWTSAHWTTVTVGGEVADLKSATSYGVFSDYTEGSGIINSSKNWTNATSANYKHVIVPVVSGDEIQITAGNNQAVYALLTSYTTPVNNAAVPLSSAEGFTNKITLDATKSASFNVPSDAVYLLVYVLSGSGNDVTPNSIKRNGINVMQTTLGNIAAIYGHLDVLDQSAAELETLKKKTSYTVFSEYPQNQGTYNSSGNWTNVSANYMHSVINVQPGDSISIIANEKTWCGILTSYSTPVANTAIPFSSAEGFTQQIGINASAEVSFIAPSDAAYLIIGIKSGGNDRTPSVVEINGIDIKNTTLENLKATIAKLETVKATTDAVETGFNVLNASVGFNSLAALPENSGLLQAAGTWTYVNNPNHISKHVAFPVNPGDIVVFTNTATSAAFLKNYSKPTADGQAVQFSDATGYTGMKSMVDATQVYTYTVPADVHYMYVLTVSEGAARTIGDIVINDASAMMPLAANFKRVFHPEQTVNWCAMGDSITYGYWSEFNEGGGASSHTAGRENIGWAFLVAKQNNWNLTNIAIGGMGYLDVASGGGGEQGYTQARTTDFSDYDLVTIALGINDWKANKVMGSFSDDQTAETITNFIPAMRATIEAIATSNPFCKIIVITPLNCNGYDHTYGTQATNWGMGYEMSNSGSLKEFSETMIEVCQLYGVQYIDMSSVSCINSISLPQMLPDGVHPAVETHKLLAKELSKKITF